MQIIKAQSNSYPQKRSDHAIPSKHVSFVETMWADRSGNSANKELQRNKGIVACGNAVDVPAVGPL